MQIYPPALYIAGPRRLALDEFAADPKLSNIPRSSFPTTQQLQKTRDEVQYYSSFLNVDNGIVTVLSKAFEGQTDKKEQWYGTDYRVRPIPQTTEPPRIIRDDGKDGRWTVYFKEDRIFGKPKGFVIFEILTNELFSSPKSAALANLYEITVTDKLREYTYDGTTNNMLQNIGIQLKSTNTFMILVIL